MSHDTLFAPLLSSQEADDRRAAMPGLRFAEVLRLEDDGYILTWISGNVATESAPARVATLMAGPERGSFFMPEPGDEVVVGFEDGDLDRPVILGALWSDVDAPPTQADTTETNNIRTFVSRAGHEITFDDTSGGEKIVIKTSGGIHATLDDSGGSITMEVESTKLEMTGSAITAKSTSITLEVDASNKVEISSSGVTVKGQTINLN